MPLPYKNGSEDMLQPFEECMMARVDFLPTHRVREKLINVQDIQLSGEEGSDSVFGPSRGPNLLLLLFCRLRVWPTTLHRCAQVTSTIHKKLCSKCDRDDIVDVYVPLALVLRFFPMDADGLPREQRVRAKECRDAYDIFWRGQSGLRKHISGLEFGNKSGLCDLTE